MMELVHRKKAESEISYAFEYFTAEARIAAADEVDRSTDTVEQASGVEIKCRVADGGSLGFELKLVCL